MINIARLKGIAQTDKHDNRTTQPTEEKCIEIPDVKFLTQMRKILMLHQIGRRIFAVENEPDSNYSSIQSEKVEWVHIRCRETPLHIELDSLHDLFERKVDNFFTWENYHLNQSHQCDD